MKLRRLSTVLAVAALGACCAVPAALGDSPPSDAAQSCLQGPQVDYYRIAGATGDAAPALDFGNLVHGSDETGTFVVAGNHGDCVGFVAENSKGKAKGDGAKQTYFVVVFKEVVITSGPGF